MSSSDWGADGLTRMTKEPIWVTVEGVRLTDGYISWAQLDDVVTQVWIGGRDDTLSRALKPGSYVPLVAQRERQEVHVQSAEVKQIMPPHVRLWLSPEDAAAIATAFWLRRAPNR